MVAITTIMIPRFFVLLSAVNKKSFSKKENLQSMAVGCANREKNCRKSNMQTLICKLGTGIRLSALLQFFLMDV